MLLLITYLPALSLFTLVTSEIDHSPCFPVPSNLPAEPSCEKVDTCVSFPMPPPISTCTLETRASSSEVAMLASSTPTESSLNPTKHASTTIVSSSKPETPRSESTVPRSVTSVTSSTTTVSPETVVSSPETSDYSPESPYQNLEEAQVSNNRIFKRQVGRANFGGCENPLLSQIMGHVVGPLTTNTRMRLGDVAQILQQTVQRATNKPFEVLIGKGDMMIKSHQMSGFGSCRLRIGEYYTTVYETPGGGGANYDINNVQQEQELSSIDFGENLGSSGYPGQVPFDVRVYTPLETFIDGLNVNAAAFVGAGGAGACFSGDLIVETREGPKQMKELKTGDEVMSVEEGMGMITFSPIIMFLHREEQRETEFNVITTANGDSVKLTNDHLIYVFDCENTRALRLVSSKEVTTSHCLIAVRPPARTLEIVRIINVTKVYERGIYSPLTSTGDIVVNGVLSSCHSNLAFKTLQQSLFNIYRLIYRSLSFILPEEGSIPIGLTTLASALDLFIPAKPIVI